MMGLQDVLNRYSDSFGFDEIKLTSPNQVNPLTGDTVLHMAAYEGSTADLDILIANGGDVNVLGDMSFTPLHVAASRKQYGAAKKLLEHGALINLKNEFDQTPLETAKSIDGNDEVINLISMWETDAHV